MKHPFRSLTLAAYLLRALLPVLVLGTTKGAGITDGAMTVTLTSSSGTISSATYGGHEFFRLGTYVSDWGLQVGADTTTFRVNTANNQAGIPVAVSGSTVTGVYTAGGSNVAVTRVYQAVPGASTLRITNTFVNNGAAAVTLRYFDTLDPDQSETIDGSYQTSNDVVTVSGMPAAQATISASPQLTCLLTALGTTPVLSAGSPYFSIESGATLNTVFTTPADDNGAVSDRGLDLIAQQTIPVGGTWSFDVLLSFGSSVAAAQASLASVFSAITTLPATQITGISATLNGTVNAQGSSLPVTFDYGTSNAYGTTVTGTPSPVTGTSNTAVSAAITGLNPGTTYHFRVNGGVTNGNDQTFTTLSNNAGMASLSVSAGTLSPAFNSGTTSYAASVSSGTASMTVTPTAADGGATIQVQVNGGSLATVTSGTASGSLALNVGSNTINVIVTSSDGSATQTFVLTVTRAVGSNSSLASLTTTAGPLSPAFSGSTTSYTADVPHGTASMTVTPTAADKDASISVQVNGGTLFPVTSGSASGLLALGVGGNTIDIRVTSSDGSVTLTYVLTVTRPPLSASYNSPTDIPVSVIAYVATGITPFLTLNFTPTPGMDLFLVDNTGANPIQGVFTGLPQGQGVTLSFGGTLYYFIIDYFGGTGNDIVLHWDYVNNPSPGPVAVIYNSPTDVLFTSRGFTATGLTLNFTLNFAPAIGTNLTLVNNTGPGAIAGTFAGLPQGQQVQLVYNGVTYYFVIDYFGGTGNDIVLEWDYSHSATTVAVTYNSATDPPITAFGYTATGLTFNFTLNFAPVAGTNLTLIHNTGPNPIKGQFSNLAQGQAVVLIFGGVTYNFAVNYFGGAGYDLVLEWVNLSPPSPLTITWDLATDLPILVGGYTATGIEMDLTLNFAPVPGTNLTLVRNTGPGPIKGQFSNLVQGQIVLLVYNGVTYRFVVSYYGGAGNDLVLLWAGTRLMAWGSNANGALGNNSTTDSLVPAAVDHTGVLYGRTVIAASTNLSHSLALCADGTLAAWGTNTDGELGNNTARTSLVPVAVDMSAATGSALAGKTVIAVAAGASHSLALCSDGTLAAWGANADGELGSNSAVGSLVPVAVDQTGVLAGRRVIAIAAGAYHSLALCSDGTLAAWGSNASGQLGINSSTPNSLVPVMVDTSAAHGSALAGKTVTAVSAGVSHGLALCADGTLSAWGANDKGQLGNNSNTASPLPVAVDQTGVLSGKTVVAAVAGGSGNLVLCSGGTLAAWGEGDQGGLGNDGLANSSAPVLVDALAADGSALATKNVTVVAAAAAQGLALCSDDTPAAWGLNLHGALGNGTTTNSPLPGAVSTASLALGERFISAAGGADAGQFLGVIGTNTGYPVTTLGVTAITGTSATLQGTVNAEGGSQAVSFDYGTALSYGTNVPGSPAAVSGTNDTPVSVNLTGLAPGTTYHFRVKAGAAAGNDLTFTTLSNNAGLSALTTTAGALSPAFSSGTTSYTASVLTTTTSIAIIPTSTDSHATIQVQINGGSFATVASGTASGGLVLEPGGNAIAVKVTAQDGSTTRTYAVTVKQTEMVTATYHSPTDVLVIQPAQPTYTATGKSVNLTLNFAPRIGSNLMVVNNTGLDFIQGTFDNLAQGQVVVLSYGGVTYSFVANYYGGTGNDLVLQWAGNKLFTWGKTSTASSLAPVPVDQTGILAGKTILAIAAGVNHNLALCSDGTLAAWGSNSSGQLGTSSSASGVVAVDQTGVLANKTIVAIAAGDNHSLALCSDGTVAAWGSNSSGQLGNGNTTQENLPVLVDVAGGSALAGKTVVAVAAGSNHSLALCSTGKVVTWGANGSGQLGNGSSTNSSIPVAVNTAGVLAGRTVISMTAGDAHSLARCSDGTLVAWGSNAREQLGNVMKPSMEASSTVPVAVAVNPPSLGPTAIAGKYVTAAAAGYQSSVALCSDGSLAAWGDNSAGQFGIGYFPSATTEWYAPEAVDRTASAGALANKNAIALAAGKHFTLALCSDGTVAAWGNNQSGELGNGTTTSTTLSENRGTLIVAQPSVAVSTASLAKGEFFTAITCGSANSTHALAIVAGPAGALAITETTATLSGTVNADGGSGLAVTFEYGTTLAYGTVIQGGVTTVSGGKDTLVSVNLTGLTPGTLYHFRINVGTVHGIDLTFTTPASLSGLTVSNVPFVFASAITSYKLALGSPAASVTVTPVADLTETISVNGVVVASGSASGSIPLIIGANVITVVVTGQDGVTTKTYTLTINITGPSVTLTKPAAAAGVPEGAVLVTGAAAAGLGVAGIELSLNGGAYVAATTTLTGSGFTATYTAPITPVGGINTITARCTDLGGNVSSLVTHSFTYVVKRALSVQIAPNTAWGAVTGLKTGVVYQVGLPIVLTAVAKPGYRFDHWAGTGLGAPATDFAALNVIFTSAMAGAPGNLVQIIANFVANPFLSTVAGAFNGLILADTAGTPPTTPSNATNGLMALTLTTAGTFTGTLKIDGLSLPVTGSFDNTGVARFGPAFGTTLTVPRAGLPPYQMSLSLDFGTALIAPQITGSLQQDLRTAVASSSKITLNRSYYSASSPVTANYLLNKGRYNIAFLKPTSPTGIAPAYFPQGDGYGGLTVTSLGAVTLAATLADGTTKVTASSFLCKPPGLTPATAASAALYSQLYTGLAGSIGGVVTLDDTQADTDVAGAGFFWFRPWQNNVQYYPWGWPEGISTDLIGTKLLPVVTGAHAASALPGLTTATPNATLTFTNGQLATPFPGKDLTITPLNAVTSYDTSVKLAITGSTATIAGTFLHSNGSRPVFGGVILQKGANSKALGFFQTIAPKVIDGTGESGEVSLIHK